jgi:CubicO group peptidase (beta-lactamase class C family)
MGAALACALVLGACQTAPPNSTPDQGEAARRAAADALFAAAAGDYPGLTASVFFNGEIVWEGAAGFADVEAGVTADAETVFNIYSTSKALTGMAFAALIENGAVSPQTEIGAIVPDLAPALAEIEIGELLAHRGGVRHYSSPGDWLRFSLLRCASPREATAYFQEDALVSAPGESETYSTFGYVLLSLALTELMETDDFAAALNGALNGESGDWADFRIDSDAAEKAVPYFLAEQSPVPIEGVAPDARIALDASVNAQCKFGGGGVIASTRQLARAGAMGAHGEGVISHSGGAPGGRSYVYAAPHEGVSAAAAGNFDGPNLGPLTEGLARIWTAR